MYAVVKAGGKQHKVAVGDVVEVNRLDGEAGDEVTLPALLLVDGRTVVSETSALAKVAVTGEIVGHHKGPKIKILKYKNKTGYRKRIGHRQLLTEFLVTDIDDGKPKKKAKATTAKSDTATAKDDEKPSKAEPAKAKAEPTKAGADERAAKTATATAKTAPAKAEPTKAEPTKAAKATKSEPTKAEPTKATAKATKTTKSEPTKAAKATKSAKSAKAATTKSRAPRKAADTDDKED